MNLIELKKIIDWVNENIVDTQVLNKYQQLLQVLQANMRANQQRQPFDLQKES